MAVTFGTVATAPTATSANIGDYRVDLTLKRVYRNTDGRTWQAQGPSPDELIAALVAEPTALTSAALSAGYTKKATTTAGAVASTGFDRPQIFQTASGAHWQTQTGTSTVDTADELFMRIFNIDPVTNARRVNKESIREAMESVYQGNFEWNIDLIPKQSTGDPLVLGTPFRPWFYTYDWTGGTTGASRLLFKGKIFAQSNRDDYSFVGVPNSDSQTTPIIATLKADGSTPGSFQVSATSGVTCTAIDANHTALTVSGSATPNQNIIQVFKGATQVTALDTNGQWTSTVGYEVGVGASLTGKKDSGYTRAWAISSRVPGSTAQDDMVVSMYSSVDGNWREVWRSLNAGGVAIRNVSAVPATPNAGGTLYVEAGALKYKGSSGTVTTLAPA